MEFIRGLINLQRRKQACVATIGNFDGVHLGHQEILKQLKDSAADLGMISTLLVFEPQPIEFFSPGKAPSRLTRLREKLQQFEQHDIGRVVCLRFNDKIAGLSVFGFVEEILVNAMAIKKLIIGDDFRFAKNREGDYAGLVNAGKQYGFDVARIASFNLDGERIGSTLIRQALARGNMAKATRMLGRPYRINGRVVHGEKRGRKLGFATANIELHRYLSPVEGVFSGRVYGANIEALDAVIYVGSKPVYNGERAMLEVHILDFDKDLYGWHLDVEFLEKLRGEGEFNSETELVKQIKIDINNAITSLEKLNTIEK